MINLTVYKLELVKEKSGKYDLSKRISSPDDAVAIAESVLKLSCATEEHLILLTLSTKNDVTGVFTVAQGSLNASIVHPREIFKRAIVNNANKIIILHNHPSGDPTPSQEDLSITKKVREGGELLSIPLLDHIIVGDGEAYSIIGEAQFQF